MLDALEREGRVTRAHLSPGAPEMLIASEDAAIFAAAYPEAVFERAAARAAAARRGLWRAGTRS